MKTPHRLLLELLLIFCAGCMSVGHHGELHGPYARYRQYYAWLTPSVYDIVVMNALKYSVPVPLILAVIDAESKGETWAISKSGARGLMQVMACYHYTRGDPRDLHDPCINIALGTRYLAWCRHRAGNDFVLTLRNYERGPGGKGINVKYTLEVRKHIAATT